MKGNSLMKTLRILAAVIVAGIVCPVRAGTISVTNTTTNTVVFSDDGLEDDTVGTNPNAPTIGSWVPLPQTTTGASVSNAASPGPYDGANYLTMNRASGAFPNTCDESAVFSTPVPIGETMHAGFAFQYQATGASSAEIHLYSGSTRRVIILAEADYAGFPNFYTLNGSGGGQVNSTLAIRPGQWQTIGIDYTSGSSDLTLTVDGTSQVLVGAVTGGAVDRIRFNTGASNTTYYIDAVPIPEPTSLLIAGLGLVFGLGGVTHRQGK
jgi:hypothetical protein